MRALMQSLQGATGMSKHKAKSSRVWETASDLSMHPDECIDMDLHLMTVTNTL